MAAEWIWLGLMYWLVVLSWKQFIFISEKEPSQSEINVLMQLMFWQKAVRMHSNNKCNCARWLGFCKELNLTFQKAVLEMWPRKHNWQATENRFTHSNWYVKQDLRWEYSHTEVYIHKNSNLTLLKSHMQLRCENFVAEAKDSQVV